MADPREQLSHEDRLAAALATGLVRGALPSIAVLGVLGLCIGPIVGVLIFAVLALPVVLAQFIPMTLAPRWLVRRRSRPVVFLLATHLFAIATWTVFWAGTEYGPAWPGVLATLAALHTLPLLLQLAVVHERLYEVRRDAPA